MRILIVEDEVMIRVGMGKLIENETEHHIIGEAKNGREGYEMALRLKPDLIITDIRMPEMDGLEMLQKLHEEGMSVRTIILTGYAEFDYARTAITLGVNDYLLKPIGVEDVREVLQKMELSMEQDARKQIGPETLLRDIYMGSIEGDKKEILTQFSESCGIGYSDTDGSSEKEMHFQLYLAYIGAEEAVYRQRLIDRIQQWKKSAKDGITIFEVSIDKLQEVLCFLYGTSEKLQEMEQNFARKLLKYGMEECRTIWSRVDFTGMDEIYQKIQNLQEQLRYGLILDKSQLITEGWIQAYKPEEYAYPVELENRIKTSICNGIVQNYQEDVEAFIHYHRSHAYLPQNVRHSYMQYATFISNLLQEIDRKSFSQLQNLCLIRQMSEARTRYQLEQILQDMALFLKNSQGKKEDISNYTIKRAINYIREHYMESISLEEIATNLDITPEYLSTLFNKEMDINFSVFLKEFRISHAKRLLKGTDRKIYEIAEAVGYHDSKYFMRVFKEVQGISPKEYRTRN